MPDLQKDMSRLVRFAAILGIVLAIGCHLVPHKYRAVCQAVETLCTGGY